MYTSMHSGGLELMKLTYSRHEDNLLRHRGDRSYIPTACSTVSCDRRVLSLKVVLVLVLSAGVGAAGTRGHVNM